MTVLSRTAKLGIAAETTAAQYASPLFTVPFTAGSTRFADQIVQLLDRTLRDTDTDLQDVQQGPYYSDWMITTEAYLDWAGWLYRAMIGPDTVTPGVATTVALPAAPGATALYLTAAPPAGAVLRLGSGAATEYMQAGTATGTGPYLVPVTQPAGGLIFPHLAGDAALSQAVHVFNQDRTYTTSWPTYSLTTDDGIDQLGWPGCTLGKACLHVQASGYVKLTSNWNGWPPVTAGTFTEDEAATQPPSGWAWTITTAGGTSTRGESLTLTLARGLHVTPSCDGIQAPYAILAGPMATSGAYTALYDTAADLDLYRDAIQEPAVWVITQPLLQGGCQIAATLNLSAWTQGAVTLRDTYVAAAYRLAGITNTADAPSGGVSQVTITNYVQAPYGP